MTIGQMLSALFNLGAHTNFWNSNSAARDFWFIFAVAVVAGIVYASVRSVRGRRLRRDSQRFGHTFGG